MAKIVTKPHLIAVYQANEGTWQVSGANKAFGQEPGRQFTIQCGAKTDIPVPANYFGDGVRVATYRPSEGAFHIKGPGGASWDNSSGNVSIKFGMAKKDDIPVPADYFGEGKVRLALFRPSDGNWYIKGPGNGSWEESQGNFIVQHGGKGDLPLPYDYYGEGKVRLGVFRPKEGKWYIKGPDMYSWNSSQGNVTLQCGKEGDIPVPADYYGEHKVRIAVFRPKEGKWFIKGPGFADWDNSSGNLSIQHGGKDDTPVPGDYFAEGKYRLAVFRSKDADWHIKGPGFADWDNTSGNYSVHWGKKDDTPVPARYGL